MMAALGIARGSRVSCKHSAPFRIVEQAPLGPRGRSEILRPRHRDHRAGTSMVLAAVVDSRLLCPSNACRLCFSLKAHVQTGRSSGSDETV